MTAIQQYEKKSAAIVRSPAEARLEEERMRDVLMLVDSLFRREETTAKLILNCLYDIGAVNLINQKFRVRPTNRLMKWIARLSKPAFRIVALRWMKKNCPELIANWLHSKVTFEQPQNTPEAAVIEAETAPTDQSSQLESYTSEIVRLRSQIRKLSILLIGVSVALGSTTIWSIWKAQATSLQPISAPGIAGVYGGETLLLLNPSKSSD